MQNIPTQQYLPQTQVPTTSTLEKVRKDITADLRSRGNAGAGGGSLHGDTAASSQPLLQFWATIEIPQRRVVYSNTAGICFSPWRRKELVSYYIRTLTRMGCVVHRFKDRLATFDVFLNTQTNTFEHQLVSEVYK